MTSQSPALAIRIRLYVTLIFQVLPFAILAFALVEKFQLITLLIMCPIFVTVIGLIMEFMSHPRGRSLILIGLAVQTVAIIALIVFVSFNVKEAWVKLSGEDFLALLVALLPLYLLIWNYFGGRTHQPQPIAP